MAEGSCFDLSSAEKHAEMLVELKAELLARKLRELERRILKLSCAGQMESSIAPQSKEKGFKSDCRTSTKHVYFTNTGI